MASELSVRSIIPQPGTRRVTVGVGITVEDDAIISIESSIIVQGNLNIYHADISDNMIVENALNTTSMFGSGNNLDNLEVATTRNRVIAYQYVLDPLTFKA